MAPIPDSAAYPPPSASAESPPSAAADPPATAAAESPPSAAAAADPPPSASAESPPSATAAAADPPPTAAAESPPSAAADIHGDAQHPPPDLDQAEGVPEGVCKERRTIFRDIRRYYCDYCGICRSKKSLIRSHMLSDHKELGNVA